MALSAAQIKAPRCKISGHKNKPAKDTFTRQIYDDLVSGKVVTSDMYEKFADKKNYRLHATITTIALRYDLELKQIRIKQGGPGVTGSRTAYKCIGHWVGADLETIEHVEEALDNTPVSATQFS